MDILVGQVAKETGFDARQIKEFWLALFYVRRIGGHGTDGHNRLLIVAAFAEDAGFDLDEYGDLRFKRDLVLFPDFDPVKAKGAKG